MICNLHQVLLNLRIIHSRRMRYNGHVAHDLKRRIKCLQVLCGQTSLKNTTRKIWCRLYNNIKVDANEIGWERVD
jgi:hypothetical protein